MATDLLTVEEVSRQLKVSKQTVYRWFKQKVLKGVKLGSLVRINPQSVAEFLAASENAEGGSADSVQPIPLPQPSGKPARFKGFLHLPPSAGEA